MRWIFITLVFINLLLLAYFWQEKSMLVSEPPQATIELSSKAKTLTLLSELNTPLAKTKASTRANQQRSNLCYAIGAFSDQQQAGHLLTRAAALGFNGSINEVTLKSDKPSEYWVYVPPRMSREEALRTLRELQKRKYDSYIITQGDMAEGVSLGLFRSKDSAYGLQDQVKKAGIDVEVKVMNETSSEYWVEIRESAQLSEPMRERIQANETDLRWEMVECH